MMKTKILVTAILLCVAIFAQAADIDGGWHGKVGEWYEVLFNLKSDGKKLTGMIYSPMGDNAIAEGKLNGNEFSFIVLGNNGSKITYQGKIDGDKMTVNVTMPNEALKGELKRVDPNTPLPIPMKPTMTEFYEPVPKVVEPGAYAGVVAAPSDALILFDGKDLSKWKGTDGEAKWDVSDGVFTVKKGTGDIETKDKFEDYQLHIEWRIPADIQGQGQARGNSGIFMQGIYELQVLDSYNSKTYTNGQAGSLYKQKPPMVNAMRKPGEWNVYDVVYTAPRFKEDGSLLYPARITVIHNGVLIQNDYELRGDTPYIGLPKYTKHGKGPIRLQDHGDPSKPISFRNIWLREL
jgi:hypothetical protein